MFSNIRESIDAIQTQVIDEEVGSTLAISNNSSINTVNPSIDDAPKMNGGSIDPDKKILTTSSSITSSNPSNLTILNLTIRGMTCASCVNTINRHLTSNFPEWLHSCDINLLSETARIRYDSSHPNASIEKILNEIDDVGFEATVRIDERIKQNHDNSTTTPSLTRAEEMMRSKQRIIQHYRNLLIFCLVFAVPVFLLSMVLDYIPPVRDALMSPIYQSFSIQALLMWILSTPVQFGVGSIFYKSAYKSLKAKSANMSVLIAIGTTAAYVYALIDVVHALRTPMMDSNMDNGLPSGGDDMGSMPGMEMSSTGVAYESSSSSSSGGGEHFFETASTLITFVILGRYLEAVAKGKTSEALTKLSNMQADRAILVRRSPEDGHIISEREVDASTLEPGDIVKVHRGAKIPADGVVVEGESSVDESFITGESIPVAKILDSNVIGSSINQDGVLLIRVTKISSESTLANILRLMEDAQTSRAPIQKIADTISGIFVPTVITMSILTWLVWFLLVTQGVVPSSWLERDNSDSFLFSFLFGLSVIVIACPCALGLATPTAVMVGTGVGARMGILIKGGSALERAHHVSAFIFDKTGTLTNGHPIVTDVTLLHEQYSYSQFLYYVGSAELHSEHILGKTLVQFVKQTLLQLNGQEKKDQSKTLNSSNTSINSSSIIELTTPTDFLATTGKGLSCQVDNVRIIIGNRACMREHGIVWNSEAEESLVTFETSGKISLLVAFNGILVGLIAMADTPKSESASIIRHLERSGVEVYMCTGDSTRVALAVADQIGLNRERVISEALPQDKYELVKRLQSNGHVVAMIGDGINDAPALVQADLGFSVGAGTDVAMEAADIILVKNDLRDVLVALDLSRTTLRRIQLNFAWALGYNCIGLPIAAGLFYPAIQIRLPPELAALAMALSSVSVITSSLLLKRYQRPVIKKQRGSTSSNLKMSTHTNSTYDISSPIEDENESIELMPTVTLRRRPVPANVVTSTLSQPSILDDESVPLTTTTQAIDNLTSAAIELTSDESEHEECCPCGCECSQRALARRTEYITVPPNPLLTGLSMPSKVRPLCCSSSTSPTNEVNLQPVQVHLSQSISNMEVIQLEKFISCGCKCASCKCGGKN